MITPQSYKWFFEPTTAIEGHMHAIRRTIVEAQTKFQHVEIMDTHAYGKVLVLDGRMQSSQAEDFIYHEALVHPGMLASERAPESGLVIGGGEGATLREILRYPSELRHEDARAYLEKTSERFDFITIDLVEPLEEGPACLLFTKEFYTLVRDRLTPGGAMTLQAGMTKLGELDFFSSIHRTLREVFPVVAGYQTFISCFGTPWGFITATRKVDPYRQDIAAVERLIADRIKGPCPTGTGRPTSTRSTCPGTSGRPSTRRRAW